MDRTELRRKILTELEADPSIQASGIGVAVDGGVVTLSGHVGSYAEKIAAEQAVKRVKGVRAIAEEMVVRFPEGEVGTDDDIAKRAVTLLDWDVFVPAELVQIKVEQGWVTLSGEVEWQYQRAAAEEAIRRLAGVKGLTNTVEIRPRADGPDTPDTLKHIEDAIGRRAGVKAKQIRVSEQAGIVTLEGKVSSWAERDAIEHAAWTAPGVTKLSPKLEHRPDIGTETRDYLTFGAIGGVIAAMLAYYFLKDVLNF